MARALATVTLDDGSTIRTVSNAEKAYELMNRAHHLQLYAIVLASLHGYTTIPLARIVKVEDITGRPGDDGSGMPS